MSSISIKLNLRQLKSAVRRMKSKSGEMDCLVIPIAENNLYMGEKGVYLDCTAYELKDRKPDRKDTHLIRQSVPKDVFEKMTEAERKEIPIIGNATVWGYREPEPQEFPVENYSVAEDEDLPF